MKCLRLATVFLLIIWTKTSWAQSDFIMLGTRQYDVLNRLEIKLRRDSILNFSAVKPYDRKAVTERLQYIQQLAHESKIELSKVDKYNLDIVLKDNFEWRNGFADSSLKFSSLFKKSIWSHPPYIGLKQKDFSAYVFPLLNLQLGKDNNVSNTLYTNQRGFGVRIIKDEFDLTPKKRENFSLEDLKATWMAKLNKNCIFISAKEKTNVEELKSLIYDRVKEIHTTRFPYNDFLFNLYDENDEF